MELVYPFLIAFSMVFVSELGDKTQLLVLSFSSKGSTIKILLGVAIGSFFSHGLAILFGSSLHILATPLLHSIIKWITYISFLLIGFITLLPKRNDNNNYTKKDGVINKISNLKINYCAIIALCIMFGELGDKTFLASIGLGVQYPSSKIPLILGSIFAMVTCDFIAVVFGKFLNKYISEKSMQKLSGMLFLIFGFIGILEIIINN